jgi:hypothetical protein
VLPVLAVSGADCAHALVLAGFVVVAIANGVATLAKGDVKVEVPDSPILALDELTAILRTAKIAYADFVELLGDAPTDPAISRTRPSTPASR